LQTTNISYIVKTNCLELTAEQLVSLVSIVRYPDAGYPESLWISGRSGYPDSDPAGFAINYPEPDPVEKNASGTPLFHWTSNYRYLFNIE